MSIAYVGNPLSARLLLFVCRHHVPVIGKLVRVLLNSDVYCDVKGRKVFLPHPYGIVIHSQARIGNNVVIMHQVTIGGRNPGVNEAPVVEDGAYIGAGAKVLGGITVGRNAVIGANAVITRSVPPGATVVGWNRVLRREDRSGEVVDRLARFRLSSKR